jgi:hypothetical protein
LNALSRVLVKGRVKETYSNLVRRPFVEGKRLDFGDVGTYLSMDRSTPYTQKDTYKLRISIQYSQHKGKT